MIITTMSFDSRTHVTDGRFKTNKSRTGSEKAVQPTQSECHTSTENTQTNFDPGLAKFRRGPLKKRLSPKFRPVSSTTKGYYTENYAMSPMKEKDKFSLNKFSNEFNSQIAEMGMNRGKLIDIRNLNGMMTMRKNGTDILGSNSSNHDVSLIEGCMFTRKFFFC